MLKFNPLRKAAVKVVKWSKINVWWLISRQNITIKRVRNIRGQILPGFEDVPKPVFQGKSLLRDVNNWLTLSIQGVAWKLRKAGATLICLQSKLNSLVLSKIQSTNKPEGETLACKIFKGKVKDWKTSSRGRAPIFSWMSCWVERFAWLSLPWLS